MDWIASLATGFDDIDQQHQELFKKFADFLEAHEKGQSNEAVSELFVYLNKYVHQHFQSEEQYMQKNHYPKMAEHVQEHRKLIEQVRKFKEQYEQSGFTDEGVKDIKNGLTEWLLDHIVKTDMELGFYLQYNRRT